MITITRFIYGLLLVLLSCTSSPLQETTKQPNEQAVIAEVKALMEQIMAASEKADMKASIASYWDSPQFCLVTNGLLLGYGDFVRGNSEYFSFIKKQKFITKEEKYLLLSHQVVLVSWSGKLEAELKDGHTFTAEPLAISWVFHKMDNKEWKVVYINESMPMNKAAPN